MRQASDTLPDGEPQIRWSPARVSEEQQKALIGLEFVQGLVDGSLPLNTMAQTLGYDITEVESGRVMVRQRRASSIVRLIVLALRLGCHHPMVADPKGGAGIGVSAATE